MTTEKHDPWALLRDARDFMRQAAISRGPCPDCTECDHRDAIIAKADAALAVHEAEEQGPVELVEDVKWRQEVNYEGSEVHVAHLRSKSLRVFYCYDKTFDWKASVVWSKEGKTSTLDEAKSAAIAAARGMR